MRRSTDFSATVKQGSRSAQPDLVVHYRRDTAGDLSGPRIGLIVGKSVGSAVERHRVARRLRHVARNLLGELDAVDRVVIRARPSSRRAMSTVLEQQLRTGLGHARQRAGAQR